MQVPLKYSLKSLQDLLLEKGGKTILYVICCLESILDLEKMSWGGQERSHVFCRLFCFLFFYLDIPSNFVTVISILLINFQYPCILQNFEI
jgi:hypothetical protein